ncbi:MAG: hypothetical protein Q4G39_05575 [Brachymonas sp.]|nr:hypothetical protein [Brachymonas sp.]
MKTRFALQSTIAIAALAAATAFAQTPSAPSPSGARKGYRTAQSHEAAAARAGQLSQQNAEQLMRNALMRCDPLPAADKEACVARIRSGNQQGSVEGGGILRSVEVIEAAPVTQ